jgi:mRNA-degrading endonuclease RelE of RelBE toxin-antitoxin system
MSSIKVEFTDRFTSQFKRLSKKYKGLEVDLKLFISTLTENPNQGVELFPNVRKIRMAISAKAKGKSGGARIITMNALVADNEGSIYLLLIYDKSDTESVKTKIVKDIILELGLNK